MNELKKLNGLVAKSYVSLGQAVKEIRNKRSRLGLPEVTYDVEMNDVVDMIEKKGVEATERFLTDKFSENVNISVMRFKNITEMKMQFPIKQEDIEEIVRQKVMEIAQIYDLDIERIDYVIVSGSRSRGIEVPDSDLDVIVQYQGTAKEDDVFNAMHDSLFMIEGIKVDVNPINSDVNIDRYLQDTERYLEDRQNVSIRHMATAIHSLMGNTNWNIDKSYEYYALKDALRCKENDRKYIDMMIGLKSFNAKSMKDDPLSYESLKSSEIISSIEIAKIVKNSETRKLSR